MRRRELPDTMVSLMVALTFVTGVVDAVGYLALDRVFTGNMTGNVVIFAMAAAGADGLPILGPALALLAFTGGAFGTGMALRNVTSAWNRLNTALLGGGGVLLAVLGGVLAAVGTDAELVRVAVSAATAAAMGEQAAVARKLAIADMTTVVVTSTLTSLASETMVADRFRSLWHRRAVAIVAIGLGALAGALLLRVGPEWPMFVAAGLSLAVAGAGHRVSVRHG